MKCVKATVTVSGRHTARVARHTRVAKESKGPAHLKGFLHEKYFESSLRVAENNDIKCE